MPRTPLSRRAPTAFPARTLRIGLRRALTGSCALVAVLASAAHADHTYVVVSGDTLYSLAARFDTSVAELRSANGLAGNVLVPGQVLHVPGGQEGGYRTAIAEPGETLADVAARVGRSVATLASANPALSGSTLHGGAAVSVPPADGITVVVREGDTLASLGRPAGVSAAQLARLNGLEPGAPLQPGQALLLPVASGGGPPYFAPAEAAAMPSPGPAPATGAASAAATPPRARLEALQDAALRAAVRRLPAVRLEEDDFAAPVHGRLSSPFGWRSLSVHGNHFHAGIDLAVPAGTPIHAARDGTVVEARYDGSYGNVVFLDHGDGSQTRYAHMSRIAVRAGDRVRQGDVLGYAGSTGWSTGPHLHFELRFDGRAVDPLDYLHVSTTQ